MNTSVMDSRELITMKLLYYFIKIKNYNPIIVQGAKNEIWLENLAEDVKIVRIVNNYIHNDEQMEFDKFKTKRLVSKIKRKTFSIKMQVLNIFTDLGDNVNPKEVEDDKIYKYVYAKTDNDILKNDFISNNFSDIKSNFDFKEEGFSLFLKITNEINEKNRVEAIKNDDVFSPKKIIATYVIIGILTVIYLYGLFTRSSDNLINMFAVYGPFIRKYHEYYRLITGAFLHADIFHLLSNCYALYIIGSQVENFYGKKKFLLIYFYSALTGSLLSVTLSNNASIGASGAIFGLMGAILYFGYYYRVYIGATWKQKILPVIALNLIIGFVVPGIDYFGHIGGLIGGVLISMAVGLKYKHKKQENINGAILSILFLAFLIYLGIFLK